MVASILDKLEVDTMMLTDIILENIEAPDGGSVLAPSYQIYLTPELAADPRTCRQGGSGIERRIHFDRASFPRRV